MTDSIFNLTISIKVETDESIDYISQILNTKPTDVIKKGQRKNFYLESASKNIWVYSIHYKNCKELSPYLHDFFSKIENYLLKMEEVKKCGKCILRISFSSEFAQIGFEIVKRDFQLLHQLEIPVEISIFSWGEVVDER